MSDRELVRAVQSGDERAYVKLYREYAAGVSLTCRRILGDGPDAEDAAQETFLRAYVSIGRMAGEYQLGGWLRRIATNICFDHLRARSRRPPIFDVGDAHEVPDPRRLDRSVEQRMSIKGTLSEMRPLHGEALYLRLVEGLSLPEMARRLDISPAQVKSLLHRARCSFKEHWSAS
jgi:RNA polymerase sigma-70 factor (ECF subfamily)